MDDFTENKIIKIFNEKILSPILYMVENGDIIDLICFCDMDITERDIYEAEDAISLEIGRPVEIIDIREFERSDRIEIITHARLIYSEGELIENIFRQSMLEDFCKMISEREGALLRYSENKTPYLQ